MSIVGIISKMAAAPTSPVTYALPIGNAQIPLNLYLGKVLRLRFTYNIYCIACQQKIKKSYQNGYCFPCTQKLAQCDFCILKPERCHYHLGTCREPAWGDAHCMIPHWVYLANASGLKVGITRKTQVPTRWIDQGATAAMGLFEVPTRLMSGLVEVILAKTFSDKTNWRKMLQGKAESIDLFTVGERIKPQILSQFDSVQLIENPQICQFDYPVIAYPQKVAALSFDKTPLIEGTLLGIKGQYLIFENGVLNIRKFTGYEIEAGF